MVKKGVGSYQINKAVTSGSKILKMLNDGEFHRYREIKQLTQLSTATLSKHLKRFEKSLIERKIDLESEEYPYPVYYRIKPNVLRNEFQEHLWKSVKEDADFWIKEQKQLAYYMQYSNTMLSLQIIGSLKDYFDTKKEEEFNQTIEYFVVSTFRDLIQNMKVKLEELAKKGENINNILSIADKTILEDYHKIAKRL